MHLIKNTFFVILLFSVWSQLLYAQEIASRVSSVTIYPYGAKVTRTASFQLSAGTTQLLFSDLERGLDPKTIEVKLQNDNINLVSIQGDSGTDYKGANESELQNIRDSLNIINKELSWLDDQLNIYTAEENVINSNSQLGTESDKIQALQELVAFYRSQLLEIRAKKLDLTYEIVDIQKEKKLLQKRERTLKRGKAFNHIKLQVNTPLALSENIEFSYFVRNVSWKAVYDLKAKDTKSPIDLIYRAEITQNTGVDWNGVKVSLSNARPAKRTALPELKTIFATLENQYQLDTVLAFDPESYEEQVQVVRNEASSLLSQEQITRELSTSFLKELKRLQDIPSDNKPKFLRLETIQLPTTYQYLCVPKENLSVYLVAQLTNYGQYHLQQGTANVFFENTFIGKTTIDPRTTADSLKISLGVDPSIIVSRKYRSYNASKVIRNSRKETLNFEIDIRNNKNKTVLVKILDQVPVSTDKLIEIKLLKESRAKHNKNDGEVEWLVSVAPNASKEIHFGYSLKYPKDKTVSKK